MRHVLGWTALAFTVGLTILGGVLGVASTPLSQRLSPKYFDAVTVVVENDQGHGSGVIYRSDDGKLRVLTAKHVVVDDPDNQKVKLANGSVLNAHVAFMRDGMDYAILDVDFLDIHTGVAAHIACRAPVLDEEVTIVGFPLFYKFVHTHGVVASNVRTDDKPIAGLVPLDAAATYGNSGGPVFDAGGRVIGVMTAIMLSTPGGMSISQTGVSFMSPTDTLCAALPRL